MSCTLFAVAPHELEVTPETSLPGYHDATKTPVSDESSALALGRNWAVLHVALGNHGADHPLGFLEAGGEARDEFAGDSSSGRYFEPRATIVILARLARLPGGAPELERLRMFVADVVISNRGLVVCHFR